MDIVIERVKDFEAMVKRVAELLASGDWKIEGHVYEEGVTIRPGITLWNAEDEGVMLRWYAFADVGGIDFMGQKARRMAYLVAGDLVDEIIKRVA